MALIVLGLQQSSSWGWSSVGTWACIVIGVVLMVVFVRHELRSAEPLLRLQIFQDRAFATDTALGLMSAVFVPFFFFASVYSQVSLGEKSSNAGIYILWFFIGFVVAAQIGGRILDRRGARPAVVWGSVLGAVGFYLLAHKLTDLSLGAQRPYILLAGAGLGLMLGTASTDAVNRAPATRYSEVTGITQTTARNFGATLGLAIDGDHPDQLLQRDQRRPCADPRPGCSRQRRPPGGEQPFGSSAGRGQRRGPAARDRPSTSSSAFAHSTETVLRHHGRHHGGHVPRDRALAAPGAHGLRRRGRAPGDLRGSGFDEVSWKPHATHGRFDPGCVAKPQPG